MSNIPMQLGEQWLKTLLQLTGINTVVKGSINAAPSLEENSLEADSYWLTIDQTNLTLKDIKILIGADGSGVRCNSVFSKFSLEYQSTRGRTNLLHS